MYIVEKKAELYKNRDLMYQKVVVEDKSYEQVAKELSCSRTAVRNWSIKHGFPRGEKWQRAMTTNGAEIVKLYTNENKTIKSIAEIFDYADQTVRRVLLEFGVEIRTLSESKRLKDSKKIYRKYDLNEDYFKQWSSNMSYILGFLYADGNIVTSPYTNKDGKTRKRNIVKLALQEEDREILEKIKEELEYEGIISTYPSKISGKLTGKNHCELKITSRTMLSDLIELGLTDNKSLTKTFPNVPKEYELDFIRGYFDGNGSVDKQYPKNSRGKRTEICQIRTRIFSGSKRFLEVLQEKMESNEFKRKKVSTQKGRNVHEITYSTGESIRLFNVFYSNKNSLKMSRKCELFKEYIDQRKEDIKTSNGGIKII